jgi:hypothetical protein
MKLTLQRFSSGNESTLGSLFIDNIWCAFTLEDEYREVKIKGETRIPFGNYKILLRKEGGHHENYTKKFPEIHKGMLWLQNVPGFQYILIHVGNTDKDTDGCILVGDSCMQNITARGSLAGSTSAYERIYPVIAAELEKGNVVTIEVYDEKK